MATTKLKLLIVEDQKAIAQNIADYFEPKGHILDFAHQGEQGLNLALKNHHDVVVLDLMLPKMDGMQVCQEIRKKSSRAIPILMLTARDTLADKLEGFQQGADDYLTKPFVLEELEVRCLALARRHLLNQDQKIELGPLVLDRQLLSVTRDGISLDLKPVGYQIMEILMGAHPQVVTRSELTEKIWGDEPTESDALRSHLYQLRTVLDKPFEQAILKTVHGVGFQLDIKSAHASKSESSHD